MTNEVPPKLRWACRRGMLELDVMLGSFLNEAYLRCSDQDKNRFVALLDNNDQDLFMWLTGKEHPTERETAEIVEKIRDHARNRH